MSFQYREPGLIVMDILQSEMGLTLKQVMFTNQKFNIPTFGLFVVVSYVGPSRVISNSNNWIDDGEGGLIELQSIVMLHCIQIDIMSYEQDARTRKEEIAMALRSIYSEQLQEFWNMNIARHTGSFSDTSFLEETKIITRYTTTILTTSLNQKQKAIDSFNSFETKAYVDVTVPAIADFNPKVAPKPPTA